MGCWWQGCLSASFTRLRLGAPCQGLEVAPEEIDEEIDRLVSSSGAESSGDMRRALDTQNAKDSINTSLLNRKVMARLVEMVMGAEHQHPATATVEAGTAEAPEGPTEEPTGEAPEETSGEEDSAAGPKASE